MGGAHSKAPKTAGERLWRHLPEWMIGTYAVGAVVPFVWLVYAVETETRTPTWASVASLAYFLPGVVVGLAAWIPGVQERTAAGYRRRIAWTSTPPGMYVTAASVPLGLLSFGLGFLFDDAALAKLLGVVLLGVGAAVVVGFVRWLRLPTEPPTEGRPPDPG